MNNRRSFLACLISGVASVFVTMFYGRTLGNKMKEVDAHSPKLGAHLIKLIDRGNWCEYPWMIKVWGDCFGYYRTREKAVYVMKRLEPLVLLGARTVDDIWKMTEYGKEQDAKMNAALKSWALEGECNFSIKRDGPAEVIINTIPQQQ